MQERVLFGDRNIKLTWQPNLRLMPEQPVSQVSGLCMSGEGKLILVSKDGLSWTLPGGHPEAGETPEDTLRREVTEEACALITQYHYLGAQRVDDPALHTPHYQLRYWARVELQPFRPDYEMRHRTSVTTADARRLLWGGNSRIATALLDLIGGSL